MRIADMHWQQVEAYLKHDDRCIIPLGCVEQHAYLSLATDAILAEKLSVDSAESLGIPVFPVLSYGITPYFRAYPGFITFSVATYSAIITEILESVYEQGFRRIFLLNGHGGNAPASTIGSEFASTREDVRVQYHAWWSAPKVWAAVTALDPIASHASWMENFPWTRLSGVAQPSERKPLVDLGTKQGAQATRALLGDGNFGGYYQRSDEELLHIWDVAIAEVQELLTRW